MDYTTLTIPELDAEFMRLATVLAETQDARMEIFRVRSMKMAQAAARAKLRDMSLDERIALKTMLNEQS